MKIKNSESIEHNFKINVIIMTYKNEDFDTDLIKKQNEQIKRKEKWTRKSFFEQVRIVFRGGNKCRDFESCHCSLLSL